MIENTNETGSGLGDEVGSVVGNSATANLTFGNPKAQCSNNGICSMPKATSRSGNGVLAAVKVVSQTLPTPPPVTFNADLTVTLDQVALAWLSANRPTVFTALTTLPTYTPQAGGPGVEPALPFTIDQSTAVALFTPTCISATIPATSSPWALQQNPPVAPFTSVVITINGVVVTGGS